MKRRRLLTIGHSYVVGLNRRLAHELADVGGDNWDVTAVAPNFFHGARDLRPVRFEMPSPEPCSVAAVNAYLTSRVHVFVYGWRLRTILREAWDLVHCWEEPYILVGGQIAYWTPANTPLVFATFQNLNKSYPPPFSWIERYCMRRAAGWISFGQQVTDNLGARPGYTTRPHAQIPLGVDVNRFQPNHAAGEAVRRKLGWEKDGPPVIGYLGRFVPEKGIDLLQRVLARISVPWRALFVGAGPGEAALRVWAEHQHSGRVAVCTDVGHDDVPAYLNAMDFLCAPSQTTPQWKEQFGRMVVEAFASGLPVIGSDSGEIPHVIKDAGIVIGESDEAGWGRAITSLLQDDAQRAELAARGLERAHEEFTWPKVARRYLDFFGELLDSSKPSMNGANEVRGVPAGDRC